MLVGIGYDKLRKGKLTCDFDDDIANQRGIFRFGSETNKKIEAVNFPGSSRLETKQLYMLGYLWELALTCVLLVTQTSPATLDMRPLWAFPPMKSSVIR